MSLLRRLFGASAGKTPVVIPGENFYTIRFAFGPEAGTFDLQVVGESYYQEALRAIDAGRTAKGEEIVFNAVLAWERDNPHDPNAIAVFHGEIGKLGYFSRSDASAYHPSFEILAKMVNRGAVCKGKVIGGAPGKPNLGVVLRLFDPDTLCQIMLGRYDDYLEDLV